MTLGRLIIVSGPSGAGKGTLVDAVVGRVPALWVSVSATTRSPRPGEREGVHYFFLTREEFDRRVEAGEFLEWAEVHGNLYGTLRSHVQARLEQGTNVILEIDPQGAMQVKAAMPEAVLVFVEAPSKEELRRRLAHRGSETPEQVETRMRTAERELALVDAYQHVIINDDVARAADELTAIVDSLRSRKD
jgi:guanylate kinase